MKIALLLTAGLGLAIPLTAPPPTPTTVALVTHTHTRPPRHFATLLREHLEDEYHRSHEAELKRARCAKRALEHQARREAARECGLHGGHTYFSRNVTCLAHNGTVLGVNGTHEGEGTLEGYGNVTVVQGRMLEGRNGTYKEDECDVKKGQ